MATKKIRDRDRVRLDGIEVLVSIGENLRHARKDKNMTMQDVNDKTGISKSFLSDLENGLASIAIHRFVTLCDLYDVTPNEILEYKTESSEA